MFTNGYGMITLVYVYRCEKFVNKISNLIKQYIALQLTRRIYNEIFQLIPFSLSLVGITSESNF